MSVVIAGAGSAALHHASACQDLGLEHTVAVRRETQVSEFLARFVERYGKASKATFISTRSGWRGTNFDIGILATPPTTHPDLLIYLMNFQPKLIYIEKPLATPPSVAAHVVNSGIRLLGGSQFVLRPSFAEFFQMTTNLIGRDGSSINCYFCEPLTGPATAHSWNPDFVNGWVTDEKAGGGVLGEYSHALFWVGCTLKKNSRSLPSIELGKYSQRVNMNSQISLDHVEILFSSDGDISGRVTQSCALNFFQKSISVTCSSNGDELVLDVGSDCDSLILVSANGNIETKQLFNSTRQRDAARLISHLEEMADNPSLDSPLSLDVALWVDVVISQVRKVTFK
jgi:hypothetical protein